ncbi:MAG: hypothetical protein ACI4AK_08900 [Lepagella sp.]
MNVKLSLLIISLCCLISSCGNDEPELPSNDLPENGDMDFRTAKAYYYVNANADMLEAYDVYITYIEGSHEITFPITLPVIYRVDSQGLPAKLGYRVYTKLKQGVELTKPVYNFVLFVKKPTYNVYDHNKNKIEGLGANGDILTVQYLNVKKEDVSIYNDYTFFESEYWVYPDGSMDQTKLLY